MPVQKLKQGRIVWLKLGPRGGYKERPAVILTSDWDLDPAEPFHVAVGSSRISSPLAPNEILLPAGSKSRHPLTKLKRPTVIVCDWIEEVSYSDVLQWGGEAPPTVLLEILTKLPSP